MSEPEPPDPASETRQDEVLAEYMRRKDRGEPVDLEQFLAEHADVAAELRVYLEGEEQVRRLVGPMPADLARFFPNLELLEMIGQGGMGWVYRSRQKHSNRQVALKVLPPALGEDPEFVERFLREAKALAMLNHPHIVTLYDSGKAGELCFILMEYVEGHNLRQLLHAGQLPPEQALKLIPQMCEALQYAHERGVVHRDIKPENILVDTKGQVKIADFGLVKLVRPDGGASAVTGSQLVVGAAHYMAPEQIDRPQQVDHRADIFSLGIVIYEMLTGQLPLGHFEPPSRKAAVSRKLDPIVLRAMESDRDQRYQSVSKVKADLESLEKRRWPRLLAAVVFLAALVGLIYFSERTGFTNLGARLVVSGNVAPPEYTAQSNGVGAGVQSNQKTVAEPSNQPAPQLRPVRVLVVIARVKFSYLDFQPICEHLRQSQVEVVVASTERGEAKPETTEGAESVEATIALRDVLPDDYDGLIFCGGNTIPTFVDKKSGRLATALIKGMLAADKPVGAMCGASVLLAQAGVLDGIQAVWLKDDKHRPHMEKSGARYVNEPVVVSGKLITARGPGDAPLFVRKFLEALGRKP